MPDNPIFNTPTPATPTPDDPVTTTRDNALPVSSGPAAALSSLSIGQYSPAVGTAAAAVGQADGAVAAAPTQRPGRDPAPRPSSHSPGAASSDSDGEVNDETGHPKDSEDKKPAPAGKLDAGETVGVFAGTFLGCAGLIFLAWHWRHLARAVGYQPEKDKEFDEPEVFASASNEGKTSGSMISTSASRRVQPEPTLTQICQYMRKRAPCPTGFLRHFLHRAFVPERFMRTFRPKKVQLAGVSVPAKLSDLPARLCHFQSRNRVAGRQWRHLQIQVYEHRLLAHGGEEALPRPRRRATRRRLPLRAGFDDERSQCVRFVTSKSTIPCFQVGFSVMSLCLSIQCHTTFRLPISWVS